MAQSAQKRALTRNLGLKSLSLLFALLLWYLAAGQERFEESYIVPVEMVNIPDSVAIEGSSLEFIHVRLRGSRNVLAQTSTQQIHASVDMRGAKPGDNFVPIDARNIRIPRGVEVVSVSPPYIFSRAAARRLVPVRVHLRGRPAEGYRIVRFTPIPSNIYIIGPQQKVNALEFVETYPINVRGARSSLTVKADLIAPDPEIRLMELRPTEVEVRIAGRQTTKVFRGVPVTAEGGEAATLSPPEVKVTLEGPFDLLDALEAERIEAVVDASGTREKVFRRQVTISVPEGLTVKEVSPPNVQVTVRE